MSQRPILLLVSSTLSTMAARRCWLSIQFLLLVNLDESTIKTENMCRDVFFST